MKLRLVKNGLGEFGVEKYSKFFLGISSWNFLMSASSEKHGKEIIVALLRDAEERQRRSRLKIK